LINFRLPLFQTLTLPDFPRKLTAMPIRENIAEFATLP
jgi:hypothetical protein